LYFQYSPVAGSGYLNTLTNEKVEMPAGIINDKERDKQINNCKS